MQMFVLDVLCIFFNQFRACYFPADWSILKKGLKQKESFQEDEIWEDDSKDVFRNRKREKRKIATARKRRRMIARKTTEKDLRQKEKNAVAQKRSILDAKQRKSTSCKRGSSATDRPVGKFCSSPNLQGSSPVAGWMVLLLEIKAALFSSDCQENKSGEVFQGRMFVGSILVEGLGCVVFPFSVGMGFIL